MQAARISRIDAFRAQGVTLKDPQQSWSGVRDDDGAIVIAIRAADIRADLHGFRCLLWAPVIEASAEWIDRPGKLERLEHCRLAARYGAADGLVVDGEAVEPGFVLSLRIEKRRGEYWALWGSATCARSVRDAHLQRAADLVLR